MNKTDLEHKLLKGSIIYLDNIPTYQVTIGQMVDFQYGYSMCQQVVGLLCMDDDKTNSLLSDNIEHTTWNFIIVKMFSELDGIQKGQISKSDYDFLLIATLPSFLSMVFKEKVVFDVENRLFIIGDNGFTLNQNNYNQFRDILKERNSLMDLDKLDEDDPADEFTRSLIEKRNKAREKLKKAKSNSNNEGLTMFDLISIFAESQHKTFQDIYENYDIYQFNNQFNRLKIMEDYQVNIKALLAGAKSEDIKIQHWLSKIKKQED